SPASTTPTSHRGARRSKLQPRGRRPRSRRLGSSTCWKRGGTSMSLKAPLPYPRGTPTFSSPKGTPTPDVGELPDLDGASAEYILTWAIERFFPEIAVACSMQDAVLVDLAWRIERSEEHTSELQSRSDLVCRLLLEKK